MVLYRPYVAPPIFSTALMVFGLPFEFQQREGKVIKIYE